VQFIVLPTFGLLISDYFRMPCIDGDEKHVKYFAFHFFGGFLKQNVTNSIFIIIGVVLFGYFCFDELICFGVSFPRRSVSQYKQETCEYTRHSCKTISDNTLLISIGISQSKGTFIFYAFTWSADNSLKYNKKEVDDLN